jgi:hypothetical protein
VKYIIQQRKVVLYEVEAGSEEEAIRKLEEADDLADYYVDEGIEPEFDVVGSREVVRNE